VRFEIVFLYLYDVGRSVDLKALDRGLHGKPSGQQKISVERRLDTPESLLLPMPLILNLEDRHLPAADSRFHDIRFRAKVYAEGVVTVEARAEVEAELPELHTLRYRELPGLDGGKSTLDGLASLHFEELMGKIQSYVNQDQYRFDTSNREDYHVFCLLDPVDDPHRFLSENSDYLAPFLLGENPQVSLHSSQISTTLKTPFSFTAQDVAIFDMDRAFLIAPNRDYEDLLLIVEHANFQLLELRALDKLLDRLLDNVEKDVRGRSVSKKLGNLQPLRLDSLFILENLENSSRIIGDYYLGQIYDHLCGIFNTQGWKNNVERRLDLLQSIYTLTKSERTDSTMVLLEFLVAIMIGVELIALFVPLLR
jgi:hypothetical protein